MIPIQGFSPDSEGSTPGILTDCENLVPNLTGMAGAPSLVTPAGVGVLADTCLGSAVCTNLAGARRIFAGTDTNIYELLSGTWTDVSRATPAYTGGVDSEWDIAQFGDATLFSNGADLIQRATTSDFADVAGSPKAKILFSVGSFVMGMNTNSNTDEWHCCAAFDDTDWTQDTVTQCASGRLVGTPGEITAGARLGEYAVAFKSTSVYLGQYVGSPSVWNWVQLPGKAGAVGKRAVVDVNGNLFSVGYDNFWLFQGTTPVPLADGVVRDWFAANCSAAYKYRTKCAFDKTTNLVWIFYPSTNATTCDSALVYHVISKKFGRVAVSIEQVLEYITASVTIDGLDALYATIDDVTTAPFDSPYWQSGARSMSVFNTSHQLQSFVGASVNSSMTTGDVGDDDQFSLLQQVKLRFKDSPASASLTNYWKNTGDTYNEANTVTMNNGQFDILQSARWHKVKIDFTGDVNVTGMKAKYVASGQE